jgi:hypothetical protein
MNKYLKTREGSLEDLAKQMQNKVLESDYQDKFKKELDKAGRPIGQMTGAEKKAFFNKLDKMHKAKDEQVKNPYAIGMAQAMKAKDDQPPLKKSTITKAHDIAKSIEKDQKESVEMNEADITFYDLDSNDPSFKKLVRDNNLTVKSKKRGYKGDTITISGSNSSIEKALKTMYGNDWRKVYKQQGSKYIEAQFKKDIKEGRYEVSGTVSYKGVNSSDDFEIVIDAPNEQAAEKKIDDMIFKARNKGEIGPRGGRGVEDYEIYNIEPTTNKVTNKFVTSQASEKQIEEVEIKEGDAYQNDRFAVSGNSAKIDNTNTRDKSNHIYAPNAKTAVAMYKAGVKSYKDNAEMRRKFPMAVEEVQEAVFDVRLNVDGAVDTSSVNSVVKMLKDKGIMAKVQPSERDGQAVTINSSASKNRVINVLGNIVDEEVQETHSFVTNKQNQKQKEVGGEKEPIKTTKNEWKTFAMMAAELREKKEQKKEDKKEMQAGDDTRDKKQKTMTGEIATSPEMNPKVDYKY